MCAVNHVESTKFNCYYSRKKVLEVNLSQLIYLHTPYMSLWSDTENRENVITVQWLATGWTTRVWFLEGAVLVLLPSSGENIWRGLFSIKCRWPSSERERYWRKSAI